MLVQEIDSSLRSVGLQVGYLVVEFQREPTRDPRLEEYITRVVTAYRERAAAPSEWESIQRIRRLFRAVGTDPTRHRSAPEALLRRILRGEPFPHIHPLVDLANAVMLEFLAPLGIYDLGKLTPPVRIRRGQPGEQYPTLSGRVLSLAGKILAEDAHGPFGSPIQDSGRAPVLPETREALLLFYLPPQANPEGPLQRFSEKAMEWWDGLTRLEGVLQG